MIDKQFMETKRLIYLMLKAMQCALNEIWTKY